MRARFALKSVVVLGLLAAACTGGDGDGDPSAQSPDITGPAPETTAAVTTTTSPSTTTTASAPTTTTTTLPPGLQLQEIVSGLVPGALVTYDGTFETGIEWTGAEAFVPSGPIPAGDGSRVAEWTGRRRLLALGTDGAIELVEDFIAESGTILTELDGDRTSEDRSRDEVLDFDPATPPIVIDDRVEVVTAARSGAPAVFAPDADALAATALAGPPLPEGEVDVGDSWTVAYEGGVLGPVTIVVEIVDETEVADGVYHFVIEFGGSPDDLSSTLELEDALALTAGLGRGQRLADLLPFGVTGSAAVTSALLEGRALFDPELGVASEFESSVAIGMELSLDSGEQTAMLALDTHIARSGVLGEFEEATPFQVESVLNRFEVDPADLASAVFDRLVGYEVRRTTDDEAGSVTGPLSDVRQDLFAGADIVRVDAEDGASVIAASVTTGGNFRGAPFVAEEVAAFLSGSRPDDVSIGDRTAFRATIADEEWLLYNNETHLLITIGPGDAARRVMAALAEGFDPYLWEPGDCLDFSDDFDSATPYAPFGLHGLRHCSLEHTYEVIHSEVLPEGPGARFPADLNERSDATCGRAFYEFTGRTELESALSLIRYRPDEDEWGKGSRYFACVVSVGTGDSLTPVEGRIDGRDPEFSFELGAGTCLLSLVPVECDDLHNGEVIAAFEVEGGPDAPRPDQEEQRNEMRERCEGVLADFELGEGPGTVQVFEITDVFTAWEVGARSYYCMAVAFGEDGFRLDITGTFAGGWEEAEEGVVA